MIEQKNFERRACSSKKNFSKLKAKLKQKFFKNNLTELIKAYKMFNVLSAG